jgi:predicted AlkP superfamily phosphohydrolase/phosphomutase
VRYTNARSRKARTVWTLLSEAGHAVGVVNVPMTFPPEPVRGFMISGMDTPDETSDFIYPQSLATDLRKTVGVPRLDAQHLGFMTTDQRRAQVLRLLEDTDEQRLRAVVTALDLVPVEALMVVYGSTDAVQHHFWRYADQTHHRHDPAGAALFGSAIEDVYTRLDRHLGVLLERLRDDGVAMVVSDHGFGPTSSKVVYLNRYLSELGVLAYRGQAGGGLRGRLGPAVRRLDGLVRGFLSGATKRRLARLFPRLRVAWEASLTGSDAVDWRRTKAYCNEALSSSATITLNVRGRQPEGQVEPGTDYAELVDFLAERLMALKDPVSGARLVQRVYRRDEVYQGPYLDSAPDLLLAWWEGDGFETKTSLPGEQGQPVVAELDQGPPTQAEWSGTHRLDGVLAVRGAGIRRGVTIEGARLVDLAPTLLYLLGEPIPDDMDGRVLTEIFDEDRIRRIPVQVTTAAPGPTGETAGDTYSEEETEMVRKRLQDLGYLE